MKFSFKRHINTFILIVLIIGVIGGTLFYLNTSYEKLENRIESIRIVLGKPLHSSPPVVYILDSTVADMNFEKPFISQKINDSILFIDLQKGIKLRQFRLYFSPTDEVVSIKKILLTPGNGNSLGINKLTGEEIKIVLKSENQLSFTVLSDSGTSYVESLNFYYPSDYLPIILSIGISLFFLSLFLLTLVKMNLLSFRGSFSLSELGVMFFLIGMFLPQRFFNITLILSILLVIKNFKFQTFLENKANLIFLLLYFLIVLDFFILSPDYNFKSIESYVLFLVLPIYASCIRSTQILSFFCVVALLIGSVLIVGALVDISIFRNFSVISFHNFTRSIHPVYYSYLLMFSILYIELNGNTKYRYLIESILVFLLILSGSKLLLFLAILWFVFYVKNRIKYVIAPLIILALFLFAPVRERFESIVKFSDLSIISEQHIQNPNDPRLNGITLRIILWQESLNMNKPLDFVFGLGVGQSARNTLKLSLEKRGLSSHLNYNAHNQFVTSVFKTGVIGCALLLAILFYGLTLGLRTNDALLIFSVLLMFFGMLSESILERVNGIAFFATMILFSINARLRKEKIKPKQF